MSEQPTYQVLARKYRPEVFADLIGQEAMVRTLKNAFEAERIAHAFIMTGIRGTGKTSTARIIAKGMNCIGLDGTGRPTTEPCGECEHCTQIMAGRHVDVLEMDAASNTSVNDIREIIDGVHYAASSARFKVYIIDEVHMLSTNAFNALLKTLEEPPQHVKFIFATTEIRKVPVTVLSRCQRFDLRRIEPDQMIALLRKIADREAAQIDDDALGLIIRAAEGSARDATSLLDQAIAHGAGKTTIEQVRTMIGLADRGRILDLFDHIMRGKVAQALAELRAQYSDGADPLVVMRDLAEVTHWVSVLKIAPDSANDLTVTPDERDRGLNAAKELPIRILSRMWQMLLKALEEVSNAPNPMMAAEMAIIRLTHMADLPSPDELIKKIQTVTADKSTTAPPAPQQHPSTSPPDAPRMIAQSGTATHTAAPAQDVLTQYQSFDDIVALIAEKRDRKLLFDVKKYIRLASYTPGRIEFTPADTAPNDLAQVLAQRLQNWTGARWGVSLVNDATTPTVEETEHQRQNNLNAQAAQHPSVLAVLALFPDAQINVTLPDTDMQEHYLQDADGDDSDWDPFEED